MEVRTSAVARALPGQALRGAAALIVVACLALSACTSGGDGTDSRSSTSAPGDAPAADARTQHGDAASPEAGSASGETARAAPVLPPPSTPPAPALKSAADAALEMMPGLYGLVHLDTEVLDGGIAFRADADCGIVMDILQSGQWALELGDGGAPDGTAAGEPDGTVAADLDAAAAGRDGAVTRTATLRLDRAVAQVQLSDIGGACSGTITLPLAR